MQGKKYHHTFTCRYICIKADSHIQRNVRIGKSIGSMRAIASLKTLLYLGYIIPYIDHGSAIWVVTSNASIERLSKLQKRAARITLRGDFITPSAFMFKEMGWLSVADRLKHNKATLIFKALNNRTRLYIRSFQKSIP